MDSLHVKLIVYESKKYILRDFLYLTDELYLFQKSASLI